MRWEHPRRCFSATACGVLVGLLVWFMSPGALPAGADPPSFATTLARMQARWAATADYRCQFETRSSRGEHSREVVLAYFYRRPDQIRMEVLEGPYTGSLLLYNRQVDPRQVRVLAGNPLLAVLQRLIYGEFFPVDHKWMVDLRGNGIHESDWAAFIAAHRKYLSAGTSRFLGEEVLDGRKTYRYRLLSHLPEDRESIKAEEVWVDAQSYFPVQYFQYDAGGRLVRSARATDLIFDTGIDARLFVDFHPDNE